MKNLSVLIKPASSLCNINCDYCFYHAIASERKIASYGIMELSVLEELVKKVFNFVDGGTATLAFQGGEPTLAGLDFFKKAVEYAERYNNQGSKVRYVIQTNGMLIDEEWAIFLKENNFLVGLSLDGPSKVHNRNRKDKKKKGTFNRVLKTKKIFDRFKVDYNTLTVVDNNVAKNVREVYEFFKNEGVQFTQYIPCLDPLKSRQPGDKANLSVRGYADFLKKLFDLWYRDLKKGKYQSIRYFNDLVNIIITGEGASCDMKGRCSVQNIIEADGSVYPCDFYVYDEWKLGNIVNNTFEEIIFSEKANEFVAASYEISDRCKSCKFYKICRGECRRKRENSEHINNYCEAYREFFTYAGSRLVEVANMTLAGRVK